MRTLAALTTTAATTSSLLSGAISAPHYPNLLLDNGRRLQVDDATAAACGPTLEAYYNCAGVTEDSPENPSDLYYYDTEDVSVFCDAITALEKSESCSTIGFVGNVTCQAEYEAALSCYAEAACGSPFECEPSTPPGTSYKLVSVIAFYNVNPDFEPVCFTFATRSNWDMQTSVSVAYGEIAHSGLLVTGDVPEPYQLFVRVSTACPSSSALVESVVDVYSSQSNLISWSLPADDTSRGYLQTIRLDGPEPMTYFLNEVADQKCEFTNLMTPSSTYSLGFHEAATVDLSCDDLINAEFSVSCQGTGAAKVSKTLRIDPRDICADTSLHMVAYSVPGGNDLNFSLFQAGNVCQRTCESSSPATKGKKNKSKSKLSDGVIAAIVVCAVVVVVLGIVVAYKCNRSLSTGSSPPKEVRVTLDADENRVHAQDRDSML